MSTIRRATSSPFIAGRFFIQQARQRLLEPVNALTHMVGALSALAGLLLLVALTYDDIPKMVSLIIYGLSMIFLFTASSLFHGIVLPEGRRMWLNRLDHVAIFTLIAGTYTPIVYNLFPAGYRWWVLAAIWSIALIGILFKLFSRGIHGFFNASIYPAMAWAGVLPALLAYRVEPLVPLAGLALLLLGGLIFMGGFVVYYRRQPDPWPAIFGHHEIWHLLVMAGVFCHFIFMLLYVVPLL
jgi:hemolysin III